MKKALTQKLGLPGVVSFLSYMAAVVYAPPAYPVAFVLRLLSL